MTFLRAGLRPRHGKRHASEKGMTEYHEGQDVEVLRCTDTLDKPRCGTPS
jgi:hypothetical protein